MSGAADNIKKWQLPEGQFLRNFRGHNAIINTLALNQDNVVVSGADNGSMRFWDYTTGYCFQKLDTIVQPGSLDSEAGIFASSFDRSGRCALAWPLAQGVCACCGRRTNTPLPCPQPLLHVRGGQDDQGVQGGRDGDAGDAPHRYGGVAQGGAELPPLLRRRRCRSPAPIPNQGSMVEPASARGEREGIGGGVHERKKNAIAGI